jgi:hypothetical protein
MSVYCGFYFIVFLHKFTSSIFLNIYKTLISSVKNDKLSKCIGCTKYSLAFINIFFQFNQKQLLQFRKYVSKIDTVYCLEYSAYSAQGRKIPIQRLNINLILIFDFFEIPKLKKLLGIYKLDKKDILSPEDIDATLVLNEYIILLFVKYTKPWFLASTKKEKLK